MITRFALFEGSVKAGKTPAFRAAVKERLVPIWTQFPGITDVRVMFGEDRAALDSPARAQSREVTGEIVAECFEGRIHHHVTELNEYVP